MGELDWFLIEVKLKNLMLKTVWRMHRISGEFETWK